MDMLSSILVVVSLMLITFYIGELQRIKELENTIEKLKDENGELSQENSELFIEICKMQLRQPLL